MTERNALTLANIIYEKEKTHQDCIPFNLSLMFHNLNNNGMRLYNTISSTMFIEAFIEPFTIAEHLDEMLPYEIANIYEDHESESTFESIVHNPEEALRVARYCVDALYNILARYCFMISNPYALNALSEIHVGINGDDMPITYFSYFVETVSKINHIVETHLGLDECARSLMYCFNNQLEVREITKYL